MSCVGTFTIKVQQFHCDNELWKKETESLKGEVEFKFFFLFSQLKELTI